MPPSLEGLIDFSSSPSEGLKATQRAGARRRFYRIVNHFLPASEIDDDDNDDNNDGPTSSVRSKTYSPPRLISLTYKYALSDTARDNFLRAFFQSIDLPVVRESDTDDGDGDGDPETFRSSVFDFAEYLMEHFFTPLKASSKKTPQPSPVFRSAIGRVQAGHSFVGTPERLSALRGACLVRDHHRCVISHRFDRAEAQARMEKDGETSALDDDGNLLYRDKPSAPLEVAHIIPHSLMTVDANSELAPSKQAALAILNMFDIGVVHEIEGSNIDRPRNALTLTHDNHLAFGNFEIFFEHVADHTYRIDTLKSRYIFPDFPLARTLYLSENRTIDPPSPRLLAIHRAIAHILHLSAAAGYIDGLLRDMEEQGVCAADGSTEIGRLLKLRLRGFVST
ncbi:hypothetical protein F4803DRAFT_333530 [Xylaria telfairii]|nr:hypothetical protein F4803DRAFT_333530 [Xylaria telfairii]